MFGIYKGIVGVVTIMISNNILQFLVSNAMFTRQCSYIHDLNGDMCEYGFTQILDCITLVVDDFTITAL